MERYYSANAFFKEKFGEKVYKLALRGGRTCPNRDGKLGYGGCTFCAEGSGAFSEGDELNVAIEKAKGRIAGKSDAQKFIAYFQSFTATYGDVNEMEKRFFEAIEREEVVALSIATRPDCLGDEVMELLRRLQKVKPLIVELGLQTSNEETANAFHRGYKNAVYEEKARELRGMGVHVVTHLIFGLPSETREDILASVRYVRDKTDGVKLQLLHVLSGTEMVKAYERGELKTLEREEYLSLVCDALELLPPTTVVHRVTGDAPKKALISPLWSGDKKAVLNRLTAMMKERNLAQGSKYEP